MSAGSYSTMCDQLYKQSANLVISFPTEFGLKDDKAV